MNSVAKKKPLVCMCKSFSTLRAQNLDYELSGLCISTWRKGAKFVPRVVVQICSLTKTCFFLTSLTFGLSDINFAHGSEMKYHSLPFLYDLWPWCILSRVHWLFLFCDLPTYIFFPLALGSLSFSYGFVSVLYIFWMLSLCSLYSLKSVSDFCHADLVYVVKLTLFMLWASCAVSETLSYPTP